MNSKIKIEEYVKNVTKNETYQNALKDAANFGYGLGQDRIKELEAGLKAYEDLDEDILPYSEVEDFTDYIGK